LLYLALFLVSWWAASPDHPMVLIPLALASALVGLVILARRDRGRD
jgi:hypothetical protein